MQSNIEAAISLVKLGLHIFPCDQSKRPMVEHWKSEGLSSPLAVQAKWGAHSDYLPAFWPGAHGLAVIDCDRKNGKDGVANFQALCSQNNIDLSSAFVVQTPSGGLHSYFRTDTRIGNSHQLGDGIDVCGNDRFIIAPGAVLADGRAYQIVAGDWNSIPALPEALKPFLTPKAVSETPSLPISLLARPAATEREKAYGLSAHEKNCAELASVLEGDRNKAAFRIACSDGEMVGAGWFEREYAMQGLFDAMVMNGAVSADGASAARETIRRGLDKGMLSPRAPLSVLMEVEPWEEDQYGCLFAAWIIDFKANRSGNSIPASPASSLIEFLDGIKPLQEYEIPPVKYLVPGVLPEGSIIMFSGAAGSGKSTLAMKIAYLASQGLPIFGFSQVPRRVLYLDRDNPPALVKERMDRLHMEPTQQFKYWGGHLGVDIPKQLFSDAGLLEWIERDANRPIVVVDSQISFQEGNENDSNDIAAFYDPLRRLTNRGATVFVIHHTGKGESTKEFRGSEHIRAAIDVGYVTTNSLKVGLGTLTLTAFKARVVVEEEIALTYVDGDFIPQNLRHAKQEQLNELLRKNPGITKSQFEELARPMRVSRQDVRDFIDFGVGIGTVITKRGEKNSQTLWLVESPSPLLQTLQRPS